MLNAKINEEFKKSWIVALHLEDVLRRAITGKGYVVFTKAATVYHNAKNSNFVWRISILTCALSSQNSHTACMYDYVAFASLLTFSRTFLPFIVCKANSASLWLSNSTKQYGSVLVCWNEEKTELEVCKTT